MISPRIVTQGGAECAGLGLPFPCPSPVLLKFYFFFFKFLQWCYIYCSCLSSASSSSFLVPFPPASGHGSPLTLLEPPFPQGLQVWWMEMSLKKKIKEGEKEGNKRIYVFGRVIWNSPLFARRVSLLSNQLKGEYWKWLVDNFIYSLKPWRHSCSTFFVVFQMNLLNHFFPAKINLEKSRHNHL